jgi:predicted NUDIX family NTP pyrophosphohydrolase
LNAKLLRQVAPLKAQSAGLVLYRKRNGKVEVLLVHPGGPFWQKRDEGVWSIPKGEIDGSETGLDVARREFQEELGVPAPAGDVTALGTVQQKGGKVVHAWAIPGDLDVTRSTSNTFELEWPPRSGKMQRFPEVDRAAWFDLNEARRKLLAAQREFIDRLEALR